MPRYYCDICDYLFVTKKGYENHKHKPKLYSKYKCEICGKCFKTKYTLNNHKKLYS